MEKKDLYDYQTESIAEIFSYIDSYQGENKNLLFQLPTGGGKTVIFSEIARRFVENRNEKVLILTHRIELSRQTSNMLSKFGVENLVIESSVKKLPQPNPYHCYVAMVETLNNRLNDKDMSMKDIGLVIIDEAHYNSFTKLFKFFHYTMILGVTATPLSSNIKLPMNDNYDDLIVGPQINDLIKNEFLAEADIEVYNVGLGSLKVGMNGDYTVSSSDRLYADFNMRSLLLRAYKEKALGTKTLIFNNGIKTSQQVYLTFKEAGFDIRHLDNKNSAKERRSILKWFKETPDAILTSVSILTTGFDEPTIDTIIMNRATKSLTLYFQMIGRGSRILGNKKKFTIIDLGNNVARFGPWNAPVDWQKIFKSPDLFYQNLVLDEDIERQFRYVMPDELREKFANTDEVTFDIYEEYNKNVAKHGRPTEVLEKSLEQHISMIKENAPDLLTALGLARLLEHDISQRIKHYSYCITKSTLNYRRWLRDDYTSKLKSRLMKEY
nr:DEAD/DEAH box helicase family protein [Portibacter marinus]